MKKIYSLCTALLGVGLSSMPVAAQHTWTDATNLVPYTQNFNSLTGTASFANNTTANLRGVYAEAEFPAFTYSPPAFTANDGSNTNANYYHFGDATGPTSTDRSFGGIAATTTGDGVGHVGIRLKNGTTTTIRNLDVVYAMEHWYNSGKQDRARVDVSYRKSAVGGTVTSLFNSSGTWTSIADLGVDAPSTATVIASRDGNSPTNRRVRQTTLSGIDLLPNQEIMIRWTYVLNNTTNGNGLSIDDVTISAFTNVFYSSSTLNTNLDDASTWSTTADGTGARPGNFSFSLPNATYYVQGNTTNSNNSASRIGSVSANSTWTVNGANSKIVVGLPGATTATPSRLYLANNDFIAGRVEVEANATLSIQQPAYAFTFGELDPASTVEYITTGNSMNIAPVAYGNLKVSGASDKLLIGNTLVNGNLIFASINGSAAPDLVLGGHNLTLQRGSQIQGYTSTAFVVTDGKGTLRQSVANTGVDVLFPVGSSGSSYTPIWLQQPSSTTARNEDVFSVRVLDKMYTNYDAEENGTVEVLNQNVKKTWLVDEEVVGNSNVTMTLQWNNADQMAGGAEGTTFDRSKSYISHYISTGAKPYFDKSAPKAAVAGTVANSYKLTRAGLTTFSPYAVSSNAAAPLPVELVAFGAERKGQGVECSWKTASEKNNSHFDVERSRNGQQFEKVGKVTGAGSSAGSHSYSLYDAQAPNSTLYYRLRQVDFDGTATYSPVVVVQGCSTCEPLQATLAVVPNPGTGYVRVLASNGAAIPLFGTLYTVHGAARLHLTGVTALDLHNQPAGVYVLHLRTEQGPVSLRVVKE
ncbi:T9SS type A sorting domain-containing protein [Hymenobacter sp. BT186]|uniref:T9SS type A sorting domain-containing protein n=1 Tax=Hymenobacter telluris TaxID=2816474 RepID=A0A939EZX9_9BACT|nr:T9SS type A sorting domain-containing protein [Hymenobacter telluris]MBO0360585.1 T9SS type A sorting domain-containing protein [Hymenobacter telluris]MBW3376612.1 T9SS type A sorting domain-containing protein [Hymenobacter norwichensis]